MDKKYYRLLVVRPGDRNTHYAWKPEDLVRYYSSAPESIYDYTFLCGMRLNKKDFVQVTTASVYCEKCAQQMPLAVLDEMDL